MTTLDQLDGFDEAMQQLLRDWNAPGFGLSVVVDGKPVLTKGYGYRDYAAQLPFDASTLFPIASNTKLFVTIAAGLLVGEGKLDYDEPLREKVPALRFYDDFLTSRVTLRDLLAHRTGITRHDMLTIGANLSLREVFDRLRLLKPAAGLRETFLYNNVMYWAVGHIIEEVSGQPWDEFVRERILVPAGMQETSFRLKSLQDRENLALPFSARDDTDEIVRLESNFADNPPRPSGSMVSTLDDMSRWVALLLDGGKVGNRQVIPASVLKEAMEPAMALPNVDTRNGWWEVLNTTAGMGCFSSVYRGHLLTHHGGDIRAFHSTVSIMMRERIGASVFVIGDHCAPLRTIISYFVYERLLGLDVTPWSERFLSRTVAGRQIVTRARERRHVDRIENTRPSHPLEDYVGEYAHPAYGTMKISVDGEHLRLRFRDWDLPLLHYHYDRFDAEEANLEGRWRINFLASHEGDIDRFETRIVENAVVFTREPDTYDVMAASRFAGTYETEAGVRFEVVQQANGRLRLVVPGQPDAEFMPDTKGRFRLAGAPGSVFAFAQENGVVASLNQTTGLGHFINRRIAAP